MVGGLHQLCDPAGRRAANAFQFANAHRAYIYDAFAASAAEPANEAGERLYRACPLAATKPRAGDMVCQQREPSLADASDEAVRERIRAELAGGADARSVRRTHCEVVASIDAGARKMYIIGGNVEQVRHRQEAEPAPRPEVFGGAKGPLRRPGPLDPAGTGRPRPAHRSRETCSLNDRKWFVLLQLR